MTKKRRIKGDVHVVHRPKPDWWPRSAEWEWHPWVVLVDGETMCRGTTQREAAVLGRILAIDLACDLVVHGLNGRIRRKDSYGNDPRRRKG